MIEINDSRSLSEFKGMTFSKYKKTDAIKQLVKSINNSCIEEACYWSGELICAAHYIELWDTLLSIVGENIHLGNPKLPIYISLRMENFKHIMNTSYLDNILLMRNNEKIRNIFIELIVVLCLSKKKRKMVSVKLEKHDFDTTIIQSKLIAPLVDYIVPFFQSGDPSELYISLNEFAYNVSNDGKNSLNACYWLEWMIQFQIMCKKRKESCICCRRDFAPVPDKMQVLPIWIIWEILLKRAEEKSNLIHKIVKSLLELYCTKFSSSVIKKRKFLIYFAIYLLVEPLDLNIEIIVNQDIINNTIDNIDNVYTQIKKKEISEEDETKLSTIDKSLKKIEAMNKLISNS